MFETIFVQPIFNILLFFYNLVGDFGIAIILFVILIKLLTYKLTKTQYNQTRLMRKIQPELAQIRKKYADNKQKQYLMQMALQKKNGIKASHSFLSLLIQLPIIIAMFQVIQMLAQNNGVVEKFAYGFIKNLSHIQAIIADSSSFKPTLFGVIDLSKTAFSMQGFNSIILLVILVAMAVSQYFMTKMMQPSPVDQDGKKRRMKDVFREASEGKEPDQAEISQIMSGSMAKFFPIMLFLTFGAVYGAVSFYYLISNLVMIGQYKIFERNDLPETKTVEESEIQERLKRAEKAQLLNEQMQKRFSHKKSKDTVEITDSGQRITRIKAKK